MSGAHLEEPKPNEELEVHNETVPEETITSQTEEGTSGQTEELRIDMDKDCVTIDIIEASLDHKISKIMKPKYDIPEVFKGKQLAKGQRRSRVWTYCLPGMSPHEAAQAPDGAVPYDPSSRNSFVCLVFIIVLIMLLLTAGFNVLVNMNDAILDYYEDFGKILFFIGLGLSIALSLGMACCPFARVFPCNIVFLVLSVIAMSLITTYFTIKYNTLAIMFALMSTCAVVLICTCLACTSFDFTRFLLYVIVISLAFSMVGLIIFIYWMATGTYMKALHIVMLAGGTLLQCVMLIMELQMILGGKSVEIGESDYAYAAFLLYNSIVDLFIKILQLFGILDD